MMARPTRGPARGSSTAAVAALLCLVTVRGSASGESPGETPFQLSGYGEINYWRFDYGPDQKSRPEGSAPDDRALIDVTRLALELEVELLPRVELEAEVEFEHGGTGGAMELEYEEFGEFEQEVEKGGEVILEELYVKRSFGDLLELGAGHFYVAVGWISSLYQPLDHYGTVRPEAETAVIPALWHETGVEASGRLRRWRWRLQLINGLDATGFSSQRWVAGGHQLRFEQVRADRLAMVGRVDFEPVRGALVGVSLYRGDSAGNRPKPDLKGTDAHVTIAEVHGRLDRDRLRATGLFLRGHLENAAAVMAGAVPHREANGTPSERTGLDARAMIAAGLDAYVLMGLEPELDCADGAGARRALNAAKLVVSLSAFRSEAMSEYADVILPIAAFAETDGTFVNLSGTRQSFAAAASPYADSRPAWRVLRVLGNLFGLTGFEQETIEDVRAAFAEPGPAGSLGWKLPQGLPEPAGDGIERIARTPIYAADALVRRSQPLQATKDAEFAGVWLSPATVERLGLKDGEAAVVRHGAGEVMLHVCTDSRIPDSCAWLPAGVPATAALDGGDGTVQVERS